MSYKLGLQIFHFQIEFEENLLYLSFSILRITSYIKSLLSSQVICILL